MDISTGLGLLAGAIVVLTMIFIGGDLRMFITPLNRMCERYSKRYQ